MDEVIDFTSTAVLCGRKCRPSRKDNTYVPRTFYVTEFVNVVTGTDCEMQPIMKEVKSNYRLTPSISAKEFSLAKMFATGSVPVAVPTAGCVGKVDAALFANSIALDVTERYDKVLAAVKATAEAEKAAKAAELENLRELNKSQQQQSS